MATQNELHRGQNIATLYDETWRKIFYLRPHILDNLRATHQMTSGFLGQLEYYSPDTDGIFSISIGGGDGNFVLYTHGRPFTAIGHIMLPILFTDTIGGEAFRIKLWLFVVEDLPVPVFLANHSWVTGVRSRARSYTFEFDDGKELRVKGLPDPTFTSFDRFMERVLIERSPSPEHTRSLREADDEAEVTQDPMDMEVSAYFRD